MAHESFRDLQARKARERQEKHESDPKWVAKQAERAEKRLAYLAKCRANIRALAEREFLRSRINLGVIKLDERQTLYLAMIFIELANMNDRAAQLAGEVIEEEEVDEKLEAEIDKLTA